MVHILFYENPNKSFYLRQIARLTKIPKSSVERQLKQLVKEKIIIRENTEPFPTYIANYSNKIYRIRKTFHIIEKTYESKLIDFLIDKTQPDSITLYGSVAKGDYNQESDIDLFVESDETVIDLSKYEKILGHEIHLFFSYIDDISPELRSNVLNGIVLDGYLKIKRRRERHRQTPGTHKGGKGKNKSNKPDKGR